MDAFLLCDYCGNRTALVHGDMIYPHRADLRTKPFYACLPCGAWVGCHPGTTVPLGRVANAELRKAKQEAHAAFDPIWQSGEKKRGSAYGWLADMLGIDRKDCHIGSFDVDTCRRVVALATSRLPTTGGDPA